MAFNEKLAGRIRTALAHVPKVEEKKMFGSLAFMVDSKMCIAAGDDGIMCRINPEIHEDVIAKKHCRTVVMRGREMKGYVDVDEENLKSKKELNYWIGLALEYNKIAKATKSKRSKK